VTIAQTQLALDTNSRFCFHFEYPATWDRIDPQNLDGSTYTNPEYPAIEVRGWGSYASAWPTLEEWTEKSLRIDNGPTSPNILKVRSLTDSGRYLVTITAKRMSKEKIDGKRAVYDLKISNKKFRAMQQLAQFENRQVSVRCMAPAYMYPSFEGLFLRVCSSLEILSESQSLQAVQTMAKRRQAIVGLLRALPPNQLVKAGGIYAAMLADHPDLMPGIDQHSLEGELTEMANEGTIFYENLVGSWALADPKR